MATAHVTLADVENFNRELRRFIDEEFALLHRLRQRAMALGETWHDRKYQELMASFDPLTKDLEKFLRQAEDILPYLRKTEANIRQYENEKLPG